MHFYRGATLRLTDRDDADLQRNLTSYRKGVMRMNRRKIVQPALTGLVVVVEDVTGHASQPDVTGNATQPRTGPAALLK